jgi:D-alanine-D-alanine ligase-like ATP-grasp enzyme
LVERYIGGKGAREFTVALIGGDAPRFGAAEIIKPAGSVCVTAADKDRGLAAPRPIADAELGGRVAAAAARAIAAAGVRDYARCDLILSGGELQALEVNGQPMLPDPWFDACAAAAGLDAAGYVAAIAGAALARRGASGAAP